MAYAVTTGAIDAVGCAYDTGGGGNHYFVADVCAPACFKKHGVNRAHGYVGYLGYRWLGGCRSRNQNEGGVSRRGGDITAGGGYAGDDAPDGRAGGISQFAADFLKALDRTFDGCGHRFRVINTDGLRAYNGAGDDISACVSSV